MALTYRGERFAGYNKPKRTPGKSKKFAVLAKVGEKIRRKARLVGGGHTVDPLSSLTYSSVVSRDSVRILLLVAAINVLNILACDIQNAYLIAK